MKRGRRTFLGVPQGGWISEAASTPGRNIDLAWQAYEDFGQRTLLVLLIPYQEKDQASFLEVV
jgi:hypothetical protein